MNTPRDIAKHVFLEKFFTERSAAADIRRMFDTYNKEVAEVASRTDPTIIIGSDKEMALPNREDSLRQAIEFYLANPNTIVFAVTIAEQLGNYGWGMIAAKRFLKQHHRNTRYYALWKVKENDAVWTNIDNRITSGLPDPNDSGGLNGRYTDLLSLAQYIKEKKPGSTVEQILKSGGFSDKTTLAEFDAVEKKIKERYWRELHGDVTTSTFAGKKGEVVFQYPDGSVWVDLKTPESDVEADMMSHCGSAGGCGNLFSYRTIDPKTKRWHSQYTLSIDKKGHTQQYKGFDNEDVGGDSEAVNKLADLLIASPVITGIGDGGDIDPDVFDNLDQQRIKKAKPKFYFGLTNECEKCGTKVSNEDFYHCENCNGNFCADCDAEHPWDNTHEMWAVLDGQQVRHIVVPEEWGDSGDELEEYMWNGDDEFYNKDGSRIGWSDRKNHELEFYTSEPFIRYIYSKHKGLFLGHEVFDSDEFDDETAAEWIHDNYGPDVDIEDESRLARQQHITNKGKQPLLYKDSVRDIAARLFLK